MVTKTFPAGAGGYAYTAAEVEGVVNALYGDPSRVQEANQWLTAFQASQVCPLFHFFC